jgi:beta-N-acetylhexosaminidase
MNERAYEALSAGCDLVLHCCGDMAEMRSVAHGVAPLTDAAAARLLRSNDMLGKIEDWDGASCLARLNKMLELVLT